MRTGRSKLSMRRFEKWSIVLSSEDGPRSTPMTSSWVSALSEVFSLGSSAARRTEENAPSATRRRISNAARRAGEASLCLAKTIANLYVRSIEEVAHRHPLSSFRVHFNYPQRRAFAAVHDQIVALRTDHFSRPSSRHG